MIRQFRKVMVRLVKSSSQSQLIRSVKVWELIIWMMSSSQSQLSMSFQIDIREKHNLNKMKWMTKLVHKMLRRRRHLRRKKEKEGLVMIKMLKMNKRRTMKTSLQTWMKQLTSCVSSNASVKSVPTTKNQWATPV